MCYTHQSQHLIHIAPNWWIIRRSVTEIAVTVNYESRTAIRIRVYEWCVHVCVCVRVCVRVFCVYGCVCVCVPAGVSVRQQTSIRFADVAPNVANERNVDST